MVLVGIIDGVDLLAYGSSVDSILMLDPRLHFQGLGNSKLGRHDASEVKDTSQYLGREGYLEASKPMSQPRHLISDRQAKSAIVTGASQDVGLSSLANKEPRTRETSTRHWCPRVARKMDSWSRSLGQAGAWDSFFDGNSRTNISVGLWEYLCAVGTHARTSGLPI